MGECVPARHVSVCTLSSSSYRSSRKEPATQKEWSASAGPYVDALKQQLTTLLHSEHY